MQYWLFKSEPHTWSWDQQVAAGKGGTEWTGVRNYQARNHMRAMAVGDRAFFYHSGEGPQAVGVVEVCKTIHPDSTADDPAWECVDIRSLVALPKPVTMASIKANAKLKDMVLVKNSRLSVQPVTQAEWTEVCRMGGLNGESLKGM
jgi:predicted RNA-binding protein with PUA-like domain